MGTKPVGAKTVPPPAFSAARTACCKKKKKCQRVLEQKGRVFIYLFKLHAGWQPYAQRRRPGCCRWSCRRQHHSPARCSWTAKVNKSLNMSLPRWRRNGFHSFSMLVKQTQMGARAPPWGAWGARVLEVGTWCPGAQKPPLRGMAKRSGRWKEHQRITVVDRSFKQHQPARRAARASDRAIIVPVAR